MFFFFPFLSVTRAIFDDLTSLHAYFYDSVHRTYLAYCSIV
jgi:hypothetical protein